GAAGSSVGSHRCLKVDARPFRCRQRGLLVSGDPRAARLAGARRDREGLPVLARHRRAKRERWGVKRASFGALLARVWRSLAQWLRLAALTPQVCLCVAGQWAWHWGRVFPLGCV